MAPRISPKEARAMYDAYNKVYAPPEQKETETEASAETETPDEEESE